MSLPSLEAQSLHVAGFVHLHKLPGGFAHLFLVVVSLSHSQRCGQKGGPGWPSEWERFSSSW